MFNNIKYEFFEPMHENICIRGLKTSLIELKGLCRSNIDLVNNTLWNANAKDKYMEKLTKIDAMVEDLEIDINLLEQTVIIVDRIKQMEMQIKVFKEQIELARSTSNFAVITSLETQMNALIEEKTRKEVDLYSRWSL